MSFNLPPNFLLKLTKGTWADVTYGFLVDQLNRAAVSIAASIAEGHGRFPVAARKHFFAIARGSVQERVPLLELPARRKLIDKMVHNELKSQLEEIAKMLSGLINGLNYREMDFSRQSTPFRMNSSVVAIRCYECGDKRIS